MELSDAEEIRLRRLDPWTVAVRWRVGRAWHEARLVDREGYVDPEDVLWSLLRCGAPETVWRPAVADAFPGLDVDDEIAHVTNPRRAEMLADDRQRRQALKDDFRARTVRATRDALRAATVTGSTGPTTAVDGESASAE